MPRLPAADVLPAGTLRVLSRLLEIRSTTNYSPTFQELANSLSLSLVHTHRHLDRLRSHGLVHWEKNKSRTLRATCLFVIL